MIPVVVDKPNLYEVINKLQTLGSSKQVAQFFEANEVKGQLNRTSTCPVARYVRAQTAPELVMVNSLAVAVVDGNVTDQVRIDSGSPVSRFVQDFDRGMYPELIV